MKGNTVYLQFIWIGMPVLMAALLDWLCALIADMGKWLIEKTRERKKKYIDDKDLFE